MKVMSDRAQRMQGSETYGNDARDDEAEEREPAEAKIEAVDAVEDERERLEPEVWMEAK